MYVRSHKFAGQGITQGFTLTLEEWTEFLTVMESITEEMNKSQPKSLKHSVLKLIHLSCIYLPEEDVIGCEQETPGQRNPVVR